MVISPFFAGVRPAFFTFIGSFINLSFDMTDKTAHPCLNYPKSWSGTASRWHVNRCCHSQVTRCQNAMVWQTSESTHDSMRCEMHNFNRAKALSSAGYESKFTLWWLSKYDFRNENCIKLTREPKLTHHA